MGKKEDITLDFSWINNLFSRKDKSSKKTQKTNKILNYLTIAFLILVPLLLSVYIRSLPNKLQISEEWGRSSIYNYIRSDISAQVSSQYPNLPQENRDALINEEFNRQVAQNQEQIEQLVQQQAEGLKQRFRDEHGETYLGDIDSYFWLRYTRNIVETGDIADERRDGVPYDNHMSAPYGVKIVPNLYPYIEAFLYNFVKFFNSGFSLMNAAYYTPMFLSFFAIIAAFFIGKKLSGNLAGFVAAMMIAVNPTILSRSLGSDNDIVNAVFPLLIMLFVFYAFDSKNYKETALYAAITGFLTGLYSFAWSGWWFMFLFIIGAGIAYIGYNAARDIVKRKKIMFSNNNLTRVALMIGVYMLASYIGLAIFGNHDLFFRAFRNPLKIVTIQSASKGIYLWPNVYTTVAELNSANMSQIVSSLGGKMFLVFALLGTIFGLIKFKQKNKIINIAYLVFSALYFIIFVDLAVSNTINLLLLLFLISVPMIVGLLLSIIFDYELDPTHSLIMTIWFMATIYASTKGIRFILLIVPAFVISFSFIIGELVNKFSEWIKSSLDMHEIIPKVTGFVIALLLISQPIAAGIDTAYRYVPSINDAWVNTLTKIRTESQPDSIINSWWDFGHWFKYWADRAVTFDGASQNSQQAHWIGKVLLTNDEQQAVSILRMLDCGSTRAETEINNILGDTQQSVEFTYKLLSLDREQSEKELLKITDQEKANEILDYMYCEPPDNYFITSGDMVGKSGVWAHFGSWNFQRAKIYLYYTSQTYNEFISSLTTELEFTQEEAQKIYYELTALTDDRAVNDWIAPWPSYGGQASCVRNTNETMICTLPPNIPLLINITSYEAYATANDQVFYPNNFAYVKDSEFTVKDYQDNEIGYGIALLPNNNVIFMTPELTGSMFTRLFYYDALGLEKFDKFSDTTDITGSRIITWTIDWEK